MPKPKVAVTGFAINSALGNGIEINKVAIQEGRSGIVSIADQWEPHRFRSLVAGNISVEGLKDHFDRKQLSFHAGSCLC